MGGGRGPTPPSTPPPSTPSLCLTHAPDSRALPSVRPPARPPDPSPLPTTLTSVDRPLEVPGHCCLTAEVGPPGRRAASFVGRAGPEDLELKLASVVSLHFRAPYTLGWCSPIHAHMRDRLSPGCHKTTDPPSLTPFYCSPPPHHKLAALLILFSQGVWGWSRGSRNSGWMFGGHPTPQPGLNLPFLCPGPHPGSDPIGLDIEPDPQPGAFSPRSPMWGAPPSPPRGACNALTCALRPGAPRPCPPPCRLASA